MVELKRCSRCVMPETWSGITFDENFVCSICKESEKEVIINWDKRYKLLLKILEEYKQYAIKRNNKYDCIVGFSGGKDSTYTLWAAVKKYNMKPLVVTFDHGFRLSSDAEYNLMEIPKKLDCDHIRFTLGGGITNALCRKASEIFGDFCWHCHNGVGALPARISKQWDIPLQIWGEPGGAIYKTHGDFYTYEDFEEQNKKHFEMMFQAGIKPEMVKPDEYELRDLLPMMWPEGDFLLKAIYLGNFELWDQRKYVEIITKELGWRHADVESTYVDWDKVDCPYEPVRDWQKYMKRGFGRVSFQASKDIRAGLITREEGLKLVKQYDSKKPKALKHFLEETEITEEEFNKLTLPHRIPPWDGKEE